MLNEFWKYWKQRWPLASQNEEVLIHSASYRETKAAFEAGYQAAEQLHAADTLQACAKCGRYHSEFTRC